MYCNYLSHIIEDIEHYGKKKETLALITYISKTINNEDVVKKFFEKLKEKDNQNVDTMINVCYRLSNFVKYNGKEYEKIIKKNNSTIYEYHDHYSWYIKKNMINIEEEFNSIFKDKKILNIFVDGIKRTNDLKILNKDEIRLAEKIRIDISK